jgi:hypothetical protein
MKTFLVTGDREWNDRPLMEAILSKVPYDVYSTLIHGDCRGADKMADEIGKELGYTVLPFPAAWTKYHFMAGPVRNQQMLDEGLPSLVIAFHKSISESKGTKHMVEIALKAKIKCIVINGTDDYTDLVIE